MYLPMLDIPQSMLLGELVELSIAKRQKHPTPQGLFPDEAFVRSNTALLVLTSKIRSNRYKYTYQKKPQILKCARVWG
jgi:hypothetical protein